MVKYRIAGPDAEPFLNRLTVRDVASSARRVQYTAWCDDHGHVLDDGTLFGSPRRNSASAARNATCPGCSTAPSASMSP